MVSTFVQPDFPAQTATVYKTSLDDAAAVMKRIGVAFAAHEQATPDMTVRLDAGVIFHGTKLVEVAAQSSGTITAPSTNPRIDRITVHRITGSVLTITGAEDASPVAPAIPILRVPVCQVSLIVSQTSILNVDITDERPLQGLGTVDGRHQEKTSNYTAVAVDDRSFILMNNASPLTLSFDPVANLDEGWRVYVHNGGAGLLTLDPDGSETIDDAATITLSQNQGIEVHCDGDEFWTVGKSITSATQAEQETGTEAVKYVAPATQEFHLSAAKLWAQVDRSGGTPSLNSPSYNVDSVADDGEANTIVTIATDFSTGVYAAGASSSDAVNRAPSVHTVVAGSFEVQVRATTDGSLQDTASFSCWAFGDQS